MGTVASELTAHVAMRLAGSKNGQKASRQSMCHPRQQWMAKGFLYGTSKLALSGEWAAEPLTRQWILRKITG